MHLAGFEPAYSPLEADRLYPLGYRCFQSSRLLIFPIKVRETLYSAASTR